MQNNIIEWPQNTIGVREYSYGDIKQKQAIINSLRDDYNNIDFEKIIGTIKVKSGGKTRIVKLTKEHIPRGKEHRYSGPLISKQSNKIIEDAKHNCEPIFLYERIPKTNKARYIGKYIIHRIVETERVTLSNEVVDTFLVLFIVQIPN